MGGLSRTIPQRDDVIDVTVKDGEMRFGGPIAHGDAMTKLRVSGLTAETLEAYLAKRGELDPANSEQAKTVRVKISDLLTEAA